MESITIFIAIVLVILGFLVELLDVRPYIQNQIQKYIMLFLLIDIIVGAFYYIFYL